MCFYGYDTKKKGGGGGIPQEKEKKETLPNFETPSDVTNIPSQKKMTDETMDDTRGEEGEKELLGLYSFVLSFTLTWTKSCAE